MKKWSRKSAVLLLAFTNAVTFALLIGRQTHLWDRWFKRDHVSAQAADQEPGEIRKGIIKAARSPADNALQTCYESFLARGPQVEEGAVVVDWTIDPDGRITSLKLMRSDLQDDDFTDCVMQNVQRMSFTPPSKTHPTLVAHTFNFKRKTAGNFDFH